jgi:4-aminobutyrate aminotransferase-like enzyme
VADLAVAASYQLVDGPDPVGAIEEMCRGYQSVIELSEAELAVLPDLISMRLCQSIVIGAWRATRHPDNADYILADASDSGVGLAAMAAVDSGAMLPSSPIATPELAARRRRSLAPGLGLSYDAPLHLVSGEGVWLRDADGREYLDAYNNVVQVGHGHPLVAQTLARQTRRLNTNTRYLVDEVVTYAERLTALLPDGLDVCYFTSSGSEANDLAWRIARTVTGNDGVVITDHAYHGSTTAIMAMSPEELRPDQHEPWVATMPPASGEDPADAAAGAVSALRAAGRTPAAVFFDTIFSSDGIYPATADYLDQSVATVRTAGGLFVADEVQAGLGRVGSRFWGFSAATLTPDIVTLGKPVGNGHPLGVVVTTEAIARRFTEDGYFFSTFGGNPVAAAVGTAVLDLTAQLALPDRSQRVGEHIRNGIRAMGSAVVGDVRGAGLFIGVEIVGADGRPNRGTAAGLVEAMRGRGVLIGRTGPEDNVLKIRPPLVFEERHAEVLLTALADSLTDQER